MRAVRFAGAALTLAGTATFAGMAMPAFAAGPAISVFPSVVAPGGMVSVSAECRGAKPADDAKSATLFGVTIGLSEHIPMTASKTEGGVFSVSVRLPAGTMPGTYSPSVDCDNGMAGTATVMVRSAVKPAVVVPSGAPVTGDGITSTAVGGPLTAAGLGVLGVSSIIGALALRRRKANASK